MQSITMNGEFVSLYRQEDLFGYVDINMEETV